MTEVLIAEDDPHSLVALTGLIGKRGHLVHSATDGIKASELFFKETGITVVLSDLDMGSREKDGDALFRAIHPELERRNGLFIISSIVIMRPEAEAIRKFFQAHKVPMYEKVRFFREFDAIVEKEFQLKGKT